MGLRTILFFSAFHIHPFLSEPIYSLALVNGSELLLDAISVGPIRRVLLPTLLYETYDLRVGVPLHRGQHWAERGRLPNLYLVYTF